MTDQQQEYYNKIRSILTHHFEVEEKVIFWDTDIMAELGLSLIQFAEFTIEIERIFKIELKDTNALYLTRVSQLVNYLITRC
jgi:acyl carrier protein